MSISLLTPIDDLYMVGEVYAKKLKNKLNIHTVSDLLYHFPFRYEDLTSIKKISDLKPGETVTLSGQILTIQNIRTKYGKQIQKAVFADGENDIEITWFNQPYLIKSLKPGTRINIAGKVASFANKITFTSPKFEILKTYSETSIPTKTAHTGRLVPIYPETFQVSSKWLRSRIKPILKTLLLSEFLPEEIMKIESFFPITKALNQIHFPDSYESAQRARQRLAFDELFLLQLEAQKRKNDWQKTQLRYQLSFSQNDLKPFIESLPFSLTNDQQKAIDQIITDLNQSIPMNRLLEGDVGSGKTVVAAAAIYLIAKAGFKTILMAPTEVLATQHYQSLEELLLPHHVKIAFFTGANKTKDNLKNYDLYLGTHALLFQNFSQEKIALVIIDEQHRFGVEQRAKLLGGKTVPHTLSMTATPIPRTAALTLYGNLSLSLIRQMPIGRKPIKTWLIPETKRQNAYIWIKDQIKNQKAQVYYICPLIDPSEKSVMTEVKSVKQEFAKLKNIFPDLKLDLMHGQLKSKEKQQVMADFSHGKTDILVSTSVIEVGIDVPKATIIIIEGAERFGLAQLHQLRGRVGRGERQSYCLLFTSSGKNSQEKHRLKAMETISSGVELAQLDLKLRGPGEIYGSNQSGFLDLKLASINDKDLVEKTYFYAQKYFSKIKEFPLLQQKLISSKIQNIKPN